MMLNKIFNLKPKNRHIRNNFEEIEGFPPMLKWNERLCLDSFQVQLVTVITKHVIDSEG